jgi:hypothetical protein
MASSTAEWKIEGRVLHVTSTAERDAIIEAIRAAFEDPRIGPGMDLLIDARELAHSPQQLSSPMVRGRAFEIARFGFRRCAVVAAATPFQIKLANLFATYADQAGVDARVFQKLEDAQKWLRVAGVGGPLLLR